LAPHEYGTENKKKVENEGSYFFFVHTVILAEGRMEKIRMVAVLAN
jgi:hypothetical protein